MAYTIGMVDGKPARNRFDYQSRLILNALRNVKDARLEDEARELVIGHGARERRISISLSTDDGSTITHADALFLEALINES